MQDGDERAGVDEDAEAVTGLIWDLQTLSKAHYNMMGNDIDQVGAGNFLFSFNLFATGPQN